MSPSIRETVRTWYVDGWGSGDRETFRRHAHDDIVDAWHDTRDVDALWDVVADLHRTFPDLTLEVTDQAGDGERLTTIWTMRGTDDGGLFAMPPTGNQVEIQAICLDDIVDGRIVRHQQVSDMWRLARQLGVIPAEWQADRPLALPD